jgi:hypothetical protein
LRRRSLRHAVLPSDLDSLDAVHTVQRRKSIDDGAVGREVGGELERSFPFERPHQLLGRVESEQAPVIHDPDPVGEQRRLVHVVRVEEERDV